jgi:hypothetical protein
LGWLGALALSGLLVICGWAIARQDTKPLFIGLAVIAICGLAVTQRGAFIGVLMLAALDGIPFLETSKLVTSKLAIEDVAILALIGVGLIWMLIDDRSRPGTTAGRALVKVSPLLLLWCTFFMARTMIDYHTPVLRTVYFGWDFLFFPLLLMVLPRVSLSRYDIAVALGVLALGACIFAVGQIMIGIGAGNPGSLIHYHYTLEEAAHTSSASGVTRVYSNMTDLVTAGLAASIGALLLARDRRTRLIALPIAAILLTSTIVQLTRARWIGLIIGLVVVSFWVFSSSRTPAVAATLRKRLMAVFGVLVAGGLAVALIAPNVLSGSAISKRLSSIFTDLETSSGTVAVRETVTHTLTTLLGERWLTGLGFISPFTHYYFGLPGGSIRNPDVGVFNAIMTMGVIGALLIYLPVLLVLLYCLRQLSRRNVTDLGWLYYGGAIWLVAALASSITLITLFSTSGLTLTAMILTILTQASVARHPPLAATRLPADSNLILAAKSPLTA